MEKIKVVAFDCDGVLFDSIGANIAYYNTLLKNFGLPEMSNKQITFVHAHTVDEALTYLIKNKNLFEMVQNYRHKLNYNNFIKLMKIEPTLFSALKKIRPKFKTALATNRNNSIKQILKYNKISHLFDFVICSSDVSNPKPNPIMLNKIIEHFNITPREAIYVGDSKIDELASNSANIPFVAYKNIKLNAFAHIDSLSVLETILST